MSIPDYTKPSKLSTLDKPRTIDVFTLESDGMEHKPVKDARYQEDTQSLAMTNQPSSCCGQCSRYFQSVGRNIRQSLGETKLAVHVLVAVFAIASWADMNGMWAELPQLTIRAPEQWTLPSYLIIISQVANIGPIAFVVVSYLLPKTRPQLETSVSFFIIILSMVAAFLMAFFWDETSHFAGEERSTAMLVINFFLAIGDCTSSVCFYAYMSLLKPQYMASLLLGEGFSGLLPGMLALIQGAGEVVCVNGTSTSNATFPNGTEYNVTTYSVYPMYEQPLFSVKVYFIIVSAIIAVSAVAFVILNRWSYCRSEFVMLKDRQLVVYADGDGKNRSSSYGSVDNPGMDINEGDGRKVDLSRTGVNPENGEGKEENDVPNGSSPNSSRETSPSSFRDTDSTGCKLGQALRKLVYLEDMSLPTFILLMAIIVVINMTLTTFLPSIQIYTVLPYGLQYYHLTTSLIQFANPVACFFALFVMTEQVWIITIVTVLGEGIVACIIYLAAMSPEPPMHDQSGGGEIAVLLWIAVTLLLIYAKVCVAGVLRKCGGRSALIWAGFVTQVGTTIGALVGFVLVNHYHIFKDAPFC